jgi:hypothetical protein
MADLRELRREATLKKQERRAERERDLAAKQVKLDVIGVIYAPYPWAAFPSNAAKDCVLFLEVPPQKMLDALQMLGEGGFEYKTNFALTNRGTPDQWFRNRHALVIVAVRGKIPAPAPGTQLASVVTCEPVEVIERYFPTMPVAVVGHGHGPDAPLKGCNP